MELIFKKAQSIVKPKEFEIAQTTVYFRRKIELVESMWNYEEASVSKKEYELYSKLSPKNADDNQLIIMEAIADLYDKISELQGGAS